MRPAETISMPMTPDPTEIEVEVLEIDGVVPAALRARSDGPAPIRDAWRNGPHRRGRIRMLGSPWWLLWAIPGAIVLALMVAMGLVLGGVFLLVRLLLKIVRPVRP